MNESIRSRMHEALDAVPPPAGLRARVIGSVPIHDRGVRWRRPRFQLAGQWTAGFVAGLLTVAVIAALLYSRQAISPPNKPGGSHPATPARLIGPDGIAVAPDGTVYVADSVGDRVFRLLPGGGGPASIAGGGVAGDGGKATNAYLGHPKGLAVGSQGNLYIADNLGGAIRRIDHGGIISTFATMYGPQGLAFDSAGVLYVGTTFGELIRIDQGGGSTNLDLSALPLPAPQWGYMAFDAAGDLYVSDRAPVTTGPFQISTGGCRIVRLTPSQKPAQIGTAWGITVVAGTGRCGYSGDGGLARSAQLNDPNGIVFDSAGNLYFADTGNHRIRRIDRNGIITTVAGTGVAGYSGDGGPANRAQLASPLGMGITPGGLIYFADDCACEDLTTPGHIRVLRLSNFTITTAAGT